MKILYSPSHKMECEFVVYELQLHIHKQTQTE